MFNGKWLILLALAGCIAANADKRYAAVECTDAGEQKLLELYRIRSEIKTRKNLFALFSPRSVSRSLRRRLRRFAYKIFTLFFWRLKINS